MTNKDITVYQGATFQIQLEIKNAAGVPLDLTGQTFRGQIRRTVSSASSEAAFTFTLADQITDPGKVTCVISATATAAIVVDNSPTFQRKITKMAYDIESQDGSGVVVRWLQGVADIVPEATK